MFDIVSNRWVKCIVLYWYWVIEL